jgi:hypothetical protein
MAVQENLCTYLVGKTRMGGSTSLGRRFFKTENQPNGIAKYSNI